MLDEEFDTADVVRHLSPKIETDFFVISGDLVTDTMLNQMVDRHRINDATMTALLHRLPPKEMGPNAPKASKTDLSLTDYIGLNADETRLLYMGTAADLDDELAISLPMLRTHRSVCISTQMLDAHCYLFSHCVLGMLKARTGISSVKGELVPFLCRKQFGNAKLPEGTHLHDETAHDLQSSLARSMSSAPRKDECVRCCVHLTTDREFCARSNTITTYKEMNFALSRGVPVSTFLPVEPAGGKEGQVNYVHETTREELPPKSTVGPDCVIGASCKFGERSSVKKSVIGNHCQIGNNVRIINSVILDYVGIGDNCTIQNSCVGDNAHFDLKCSVKDCNVGARFEGAEEAEYKNENLELVE